MDESKKWRMDYSEYPESDQGLQSIGETLVHVILALSFLFAVYAFFAKTEWEPVLQSSVVTTNTVESKGLGLFDATEEKGQSDDEEIDWN